MGPTFIKLGQLMSSRVDLLSPPYIEALSRLQDDVAPFSFEEVEDIISSELQVRLSKVFPDLRVHPACRGLTRARSIARRCGTAARSS